MSSTDHVPRLCRVCEAPLTAQRWCWVCKRDRRPKDPDPFKNDLGNILKMILDGDERSSV